jgi:integrase
VRDRSVFVVGQEAVELGVPAKLLGCPFLIGDDLGRRQINRYLEDRFLGRWRPQGSSRRMRFRPAPASVKQTAHRLNNYLHWLQFKGLSWEDSDEADLDEYADDMEAGEWTIDRQHGRLSGSTVASRQVEAIQAMLWEVSRKERSFEPGVRRIKVMGSGSGGAFRPVQRTIYDVVRRVDPAEIVFPTAEQVTAHIASVADPALRLAAKLIYQCGLRGSEPSALLASDLPGKRRAGPFGLLGVLGKGRKRRRVELDPALEGELEEFKDFEWLVRVGRRPKPADVLLVNVEGRPLSYRAIWRQFAGVDWTPHMGRHFYSIHYLLRGWEAQKLLANRNGYLLANDQIPHLLSQELLLLQKNLGHAEPSTTQRYLVALSQFTRNCDIALAYQNEICG